MVNDFAFEQSPIKRGVLGANSPVDFSAPVKESYLGVAEGVRVEFYFISGNQLHGVIRERYPTFPIGNSFSKSHLAPGWQHRAHNPDVEDLNDASLFDIRYAVKAREVTPGPSISVDSCGFALL